MKAIYANKKPVHYVYADDALQTRCGSAWRHRGHTFKYATVDSAKVTCRKCNLLLGMDQRKPTQGA